MEKKKVHIISHSHWDREWYLPFEEHHMRLIKLIDDVLDLIKTDTNFNSFHLDGQTIILDDYIAVKPERIGELKDAISKKKLIIGPFYILQDAFLISGEANIRNVLLGVEEANKWGSPLNLGYFPDTFGLPGQIPQLMKSVNIPHVAFGRGVKSVEFDNRVTKSSKYSSSFSELKWKSPDGSAVLGILFANWYNNGNEIPVDRDKSKGYWSKKLKDVEEYASTNNLLMMNGVDHQPVQKNISKAIKTANDLFPNYEFVHSSFEQYLEDIKTDLPPNLSTIEGELTSQETDGWYTLANTASTRVYLKQMNTIISRQLENIAEPLATIASTIDGEYPHSILDYAWKMLMKNHPHDSICGCSIDEVHRGMVTRFEKVRGIVDYIIDQSTNKLIDNFNTSAFSRNAWNFTVFNTVGVEKTGIAEIDISLEKRSASTKSFKKWVDEMKLNNITSYRVLDQAGKIVPSEISEEKLRFNYELPNDKFRKSFIEKYVTVKLGIDKMKALTWETFSLVEVNETIEQQSQIILKEATEYCIENDFVKVCIAPKGNISIFDKSTKKTIEDVMTFEDSGDIGNEYVYKEAVGTHRLLSTEFPYEIEIIENNMINKSIRIKNRMKIPESASKTLEEEQRSLVEFKKRTSNRSSKYIDMTIETIITIGMNDGIVHFKTEVDNKAKDHRLRVLIPTHTMASTHECESVYEVVKRENFVDKMWKNPSNPQHQHSFVNLHTEDFGVTVSNIGLNEYEVINDKIAITLLRCVGELGDWGYFPTPDAQCLGKHSFEYAIEIHGKGSEKFKSYKNSLAFQVPFTCTQVTKVGNGVLPPQSSFVEVDSDTFITTALKRKKYDNTLILRGYNMDNLDHNLFFNSDVGIPTKFNIFEEEIGAFKDKIHSSEILTIGFKPKNNLKNTGGSK